MDMVSCSIYFLFLVVFRIYRCHSVTETKAQRLASFDGFSCPKEDVMFLQTDFRSRIECVTHCSKMSDCSCVFYKQCYCQGCRGLCHYSARLPMLAGTMYYYKRPGAFSSLDGVVMYDSKFYLIVESQTTWYDARNYCIGLEATLIYIETQAELNWIAGLLGGQTYYWSDGILFENRFVWSHSGYPVNQTFFGSGQPDGSGKCMGLWDNVNFLLDDLGCSSLKSFICKSF